MASPQTADPHADRPIVVYDYRPNDHIIYNIYDYRPNDLSGSLALEALLIGVHCKKRYINL